MAFHGQSVALEGVMQSHQQQEQSRELMCGYEPCSCVDWIMICIDTMIVLGYGLLMRMSRREIARLCCAMLDSVKKTEYKRGLVRLNALVIHIGTKSPASGLELLILLDANHTGCSRSDDFPLPLNNLYCIANPSSLFSSKQRYPRLSPLDILTNTKF